MTLNVPLLYQTYREWQEFQYVDPRLQGPFLACARAFWVRFNKPLMLTCVMRSPAENEADGGKPDSGHLLDVGQAVRAIDIRVGAIQNYPGLEPQEREWLVDFWYANFRFASFWSCIDEGNHIHIQVPRGG